MTPTARPLPAVIGSTENALRALLLQLLAATPLDGDREWVALNLVDRSADDGTSPLDVVGGGLGLGESDVVSLLRSLEGKGLLHRAQDDWRISPRGTEVLTGGRERVAAATAHLVDGIADADLATAVRVLDRVREQADKQRSRVD